MTLQYVTPAWKEQFMMLNENGLHCCVPHFRVYNSLKENYTFDKGEEERYKKNQAKLLNRGSVEKVADQMAQWHEEAIVMNGKFKFYYTQEGY